MRRRLMIHRRKMAKELAKGLTAQPFFECLPAFCIGLLKRCRHHANDFCFQQISDGQIQSSIVKDGKIR